MYAEVKDYVMETGRASTSNLQRRFGLGYNRAARMIDMMEQEGIVGPAQGSKPRDVYKHN
jgi:S-DNA-T family DNA segregation ATPase FtsK/SpoIIIE